MNAPIHTPRRARKARELSPHLAIHDWLAYNLPLGWIVHHSPNQGHGRSAKQGAILKRMGTLAGWPDLIILGPTNGPWPHIWFVEVKAKSGSHSTAQDALHEVLKRLGYPVGTARTIDDMRQLARRWGLPTREVS